MVYYTSTILVEPLQWDDSAFTFKNMFILLSDTKIPYGIWPYKLNMQTYWEYICSCLMLNLSENQWDMKNGAHNYVSKKLPVYYNCISKLFSFECSF